MIRGPAEIVTLAAFPMAAAMLIFALCALPGAMLAEAVLSAAIVWPPQRTEPMKLRVIK